MTYERKNIYGYLFDLKLVKSAKARMGLVRASREITSY